MGEMFGEKVEVERRRDSFVRRDVSDNGNQIIDVRPTAEEGSSKKSTIVDGPSKSSAEKRHETDPKVPEKKATSRNQGGFRDTAHDIITVGFAKILRLKLRKKNSGD